MISEKAKKSRAKQVLVGVLGIVSILLIFIILLLFWRKIPGLTGEVVGIFTGLLFTPFVMEASFATMGILLVISLNIWRRHKEGEEFVALDDSSKKEEESSNR